MSDTFYLSLVLIYFLVALRMRPARAFPPISRLNASPSSPLPLRSSLPSSETRAAPPTMGDNPSSLRRGARSLVARSPKAVDSPHTSLQCMSVARVNFELIARATTTPAASYKCDSQRVEAHDRANKEHRKTRSKPAYEVHNAQ